MVCPLAVLAVYPTQHFSQGLGCSDLLMEGGHSTLFGVPSSVNQRLWAISNNEQYLHLVRDVQGDLWEQGEYVQCETQAVFVGHTLTFCEGANGCPDLVPHVGRRHFCLLEEIGQMPVVLQLVIVHHFMHLLPGSISFGM